MNLHKSPTPELAVNRTNQHSDAQQIFGTVRGAMALMAVGLALTANAQTPDPVQNTPQAPVAAPVPAAPAPVAANVAPESDPALRLPELNAAEWFKGFAGTAFSDKVLSHSKKVAVMGFKVVFVTENFARARVRASYMPGRDTSGASQAMQVNLKGVDDATLQTLADQAYARFAAQLRAAGREVITPADGQWDYSEFKADPSPSPAEFMQAKGRAFSPKGMPVWSQRSDPWGGITMDQTNMKAMSIASNKAGALLAISPTIVVDFAQMASSGNRSGLIARTAEVGTTLAISVNRIDTRFVRAEEVKFGIIYKGDDGWLQLTRPLETDLEFAVLKTAEKDHGTGVAGFLSKAFVGNAKTAFRAAETSNEEYSKAATAVLERATGTLAKLFAENPAK